MGLRTVPRVALGLAVMAGCGRAMASYNQFKLNGAIIGTMAGSAALIAGGLVSLAVAGVMRGLLARGGPVVWGVAAGVPSAAPVIFGIWGLSDHYMNGRIGEPVESWVGLGLVVPTALIGGAIGKLVDRLGWWGVLVAVASVAATIGAAALILSALPKDAHGLAVVPFGALVLLSVACLVWPGRTGRMQTDSESDLD